jgi:DNA-binding MarR family transcriptional regulator
MIALKQTVLRDIGAIARTIQSLSDVSYKGLGLQKGQFVFLTRICENPGVNQNKLSELVRVDKTTTTKAVQKLEALGYIDKTTDGDDGRARLLSPSPKASEIYDVLIADENDNLDICLSGFSAEEIRLVSELLVRMRGNLDRHRAGAKRHAAEEVAP